MHNVFTLKRAILCCTIKIIFHLMTITYESRIIRKRKKLQIDRLFLILEEKSIIRIYNDITLSQRHLKFNCLDYQMIILLKRGNTSTWSHNKKIRELVHRNFPSIGRKRFNYDGRSTGSRHLWTIILYQKCPPDGTRVHG